MDRLRDSGLESLQTPIVAAVTMTVVAVMACTVSHLILKTLRTED